MPAPTESMDIMENPLTVDLDDESVLWLIEAARHWPGGMGHVADELRYAYCDRRDAR